MVHVIVVNSLLRVCILMLNTVICRDGVCKYKKESFTEECSDCDIVEQPTMIKIQNDVKQIFLMREMFNIDLFKYIIYILKA